jgi:DNA invertase Pin-like site-specific DNA recombinase
MANGKFVAYYRVSTKRQGNSGLGLEAQQADVSRYLNGGNRELIAEYTEIESGTRKGNGKRPMLTAALAECKVNKATLLIAKLDRLYRNVAAQSALMEAGVDFIAIDNANATKLTLHILAAIAEDEAEKISQRTKAALAARRAKGLPMGAECWQTDKGLLSPEHQDKGRTLSAQTNREKADAAAKMICTKISEVKQETG